MLNGLEKFSRVDDIYAKLEKIEDYDVKYLSFSKESAFELDDTTSAYLSDNEYENSAKVSAVLSFDENRFHLTKEVLLNLAASLGVSARTLKEVPGSIIAPVLTYQINNVGIKNKTGISLIVRNNTVERFQGEKSYKFGELIDHTLNDLPDVMKTDYLRVTPNSELSPTYNALRIVAPDISHRIETGTGETEIWSQGVQLIVTADQKGNLKLRLDGYLHNWESEAGLAFSTADSTMDMRKLRWNSDALMDWSPIALNSINDKIDQTVDLIRKLGEIPIKGHLNEIFMDTMSIAKIPAKASATVFGTLVTQGNFTGYGMLKATMAGSEAVSGKELSNITLSAGYLPFIFTDLCESCYRIHST